MLRRFFLSAAPASLLALLLLFALQVQARLWAPYWDTRSVQAILTWDALGYYIYLPAHFIYHDLRHFAFMPDILREYSPTGSFYQAFQVPGAAAGDLVTKYTCGVAVLETPFFWLGHLAAKRLGYPADGFSAPYQVAIAFGGMLYGLLGLGLLRRVLLRYFPDVVTTLVLVTLVLGSNYFQYAVFDSAMSHVYAFAGYALLLWLTVRYWARPGRGWAFGIGLTLGLLALIRPSEAVAVVLPLLWGVPNLAALGDRAAFFQRRWLDVLLVGAGGLLGVLPQGLYWHWATGHWLFYSYGDQHFSWLRPHLWDVLFSFRKGWLIYSPLLLLVLAGFGALWRQRRGLAVPTLAFFVLNLWVVSAWDIWWYGGSFGQRALVQSYAVLALPWAAAVAWLLAPGRAVAWRVAGAAAAVSLVSLNLFQHWQYMRTIIHPEEMNRRYYFAVFNNVSPTPADYAQLDDARPLPHAEHYYQPRLLGKLDFEQAPPDAATGISAAQGYYSRQSYYSTPAKPYSPTLAVPLSATTLHGSDYVRVSGRVFTDGGAWGDKLVCSLDRADKPVQWTGVRMQNAGSPLHGWNYVYFYIRLPADAQPTDVLKAYVLNENGTPCYLDDLMLEAMKPQTVW